ncbi:MAG: CDP-glucose 4,6-dehydratase [Deltaproteobacteria bacterium CG11_big_fil_rev_8_21_14_0_20_47_16]|nr:MAG: CDP-glucose 4,6-dehydratase [Deltaproteobacteria bacterium CG11_big_fil_rev_8_21_14_0_20_47_16]
METLVNKFKGKRVLVTGHTGFKGGWFSLWMSHWGANVLGYSIDVPTKPSFFDATQLATRIDDRRGDIRSLEDMQKVFSEFKPELVFHFAAQPMVLESYHNPLSTFSTNVMGTANVLECVRNSPDVKLTMVVTSDKCYENHEKSEGYREGDPLGGHDPYSASKAATEIVAQAWFNSFFKHLNTRMGYCTVRAGNVFGGGDWGQYRLIPDFVRAVTNNHVLKMRHPKNVRPWQHVLNCLWGYILLASHLMDEPEKFSGHWNFGPRTSDHLTAGEVIQSLQETWGKGQWEVEPQQNNQLKETTLLALNWDKAAQNLGWQPVWDLQQGIEKTVEWYNTFLEDPKNIMTISQHHLDTFLKAVQ